MMPTTNILRVLTLLAAASAGCEQEPPLLEVHALPKSVSDIDVTYLPFEYADSGHIYHTPLLAMELAVHGIPSVPVRVENCDSEERLKAPNGDRWMYHEALGISHEGGVGVVDPILSSELLTVGEFQQAFDDENSRVVVGEDGEFRPFECRTTVIEDVPARVEEMGPFLFANVMIHCSYMRRFLRDIGGDYAAREKKLIARVRELTLGIEALGLLEVWEEPELELVRRGPYCPPPIPKK